MRQDKPEKPKPVYTDEQLADIQEQIKAAQEERDYINSNERSFRDRLLQLQSSYAQNIDGVPLIDKFDVEAWQKEWNAFRERHHMPALNFEEMKERAARRATSRGQ
jgi:hypothetical protein